MVGPENFIPTEFSGDADAADQGRSLRTTILGKGRGQLYQKAGPWLNTRYPVDLLWQILLVTSPVLVLPFCVLAET